MSHPATTRWDLDAEAVAIKIRWFGLVVGYLYANFGSSAEALPLNAILALGFAFTTLDTFYSWRGRVVLGTHPLIVSCLEALFIGLLCFSDGGLDSPFRYYYILSLVCAALRHPPIVTGITCGLDCVSYGLLFFSLPAEQRQPISLALGLIVLVWITWAAVA